MEEVLLRFPHLGQNIFESLTNQDLAQCREICQMWKDFIDVEKFFVIRRIRAFFMKLPISLEKALKQSTFEQVKEMASTIQKFQEMWNSEMSPLHDAVAMDRQEDYKIFWEIFDPSNIDLSNGEELTPLQMAAGKGYLAICKLIRNNENNYYKNIFRFAKGKTPVCIFPCRRQMWCKGGSGHLEVIFRELYCSGNVWVLALLGQNPEANYCWLNKSVPYCCPPRRIPPRRI